MVTSATSSVLGNLVKPMAKKALKSGVEHAGNKIGQKAAEKSGNLIIKKLHKGFNKPKSVNPERSDRKPILKKKKNDKKQQMIISID